MLENRRHFRLRELIDVTWKVDDQEISGEGMVINISQSGVFLQTDKVFKPSDDCVLTIESEAENFSFAPTKGKVMWFRRIHNPKECFQCGIQFLADNLDRNFQEKFEKKVSQISEAGDARILGNLAY